MESPVQATQTTDSYLAQSSMWRHAFDDLKVVPGRVGMTWRVALLCALVTGVGMLFHIPEVAISCYLVIFLIKPDAVANIATGIGFLVILPGIIALMSWITTLTSGSTLHIMIAIVISSLILLYVGAATQMGEKAGVAALIIAFILTLVAKAPFAEAATFGLRQAWTMAAMPMILLVGFSLVLGFSPIRLLRDKLRARLAAAARALESGDLTELRALLQEGNTAFSQQALAGQVLRLVPMASARQISTDVRAGYALMLAISALPDTLNTHHRAALVHQIHSADEALGAGERPPRVLASHLTKATDPAEHAAWYALDVLAGAPEPRVIPAPKIPFVAPDALTNPAYPRFAIKTTAAAVICFLIYTSVDWQGIHTAMVTCYVAALATTGETVHKLALRIVGCLIGAAMGVAAIFWVIPHIDSIGALMVLVFLGCLVGAWISTGPERISYAGVQVALAFLLTVLQGFGPSVSLDTAWDRIVGILLGNLIVYLIFTRVWPAPVEGEIRSLIAQALSGLARLARLDVLDRRSAIGSAAQIETLIGKSEESLSLLKFEPSHLRPSPKEKNDLVCTISTIEQLNRKLWLSDSADLSETALRLEQLAARFDAPLTGKEDAPKCEQSMPEPSNSHLEFTSELNQIERAAR